MAFVPRTSPPIRGDLNFISRLSGFKGRNGCIPIDHSDGWVMPNCTGYAWGRFSEILGKPCKLATSHAKYWYGNKSDGYTRRNTPQLGAVICWYESKYGHVAIVEKINSDKSIVTSESNYSSGYFKIRTLYPPNYRLGSRYTLQGFIYNPGCDGLADKLSQFIAEAESHVGESNKWTRNLSGVPASRPWDTAFIVAVSKTTGGLLNQILPSTDNVSDFVRRGVIQYNGVWIPGPAQYRSAIPVPGDFILFRWNSISDYIHKDAYYSDHIGIVRKVDKNKVYTVEGDVGSTNHDASVVKFKDYALDYNCINGYFRPDWAKVGANSNNLITNDLGPLYTTQNTRKDALIRDIGYLDSKYEPSIKSSNIQLSVMNYTFLLNSLYEFGMPISGLSTDSNTVLVDNLSNNAKSVVQFMMAQGLNAAAGVGVAANIKHESGFRTDAIGDNGTSFGICQWHLSRGEKMKQMAGTNWKTNMSGQLQYLWYELTTSYKSTLRHLKSVTNNEAGAKSAAEYFVRNFERPVRYVQRKINDVWMTVDVFEERQDTASQLWKQLVPILKSN